jgi:hypothetical protein
MITSAPALLVVVIMTLVFLWQQQSHDHELGSGLWASLAVVRRSVR